MLSSFKLHQASLHDGPHLIHAQPDLLPVPRSARTWNSLHLAGQSRRTTVHVSPQLSSRILDRRSIRYARFPRISYAIFIIADSQSQYQVASTAVVAGLSPGAAIGAVFLGHFLVSLATAANGWIGTTHGINFPVLARVAFGVNGTMLAILCRAVAATVWFGTQTFQGGQCIEVMLGAIWPSFKQFPNRLPPSAHVTSSQLLCFFIFYIIQLPLLGLRHLFMLKVVVMPIFGFTLCKFLLSSHDDKLLMLQKQVGWAVGTARGFGPIFSQSEPRLSTLPVPVLFFSAMSSAIAPKATLALNICDFTRFAKNPRDVIWTNIVSLSIPVTLCAVLGIVVTSATEVIYGVSTWNPLQVCQLWNNRAAAFFAAFCWGLAVIATNISANSTAVGNDLTIVFPKYVNIRRGQYICAILGLATCPWIIQNSAASFTSFLYASGLFLSVSYAASSGGYSIFLGPICGIILSDYFIYRRKHIDVASLFQRQTSEYWYTYGVNPRAVAAFFFALIPTLPGFVAKVNNKVKVPLGATYLFSIVWPIGLLVGSLCYLLLSFAWPPPAKNVQSASASASASILTNDEANK
ncbi:NCS1 nucleoside transporter family [Mycena kentingensis (nom. inval.)]|nr:NCS1 nucleoside transporter family [Mycena kentingensis (nom. inval.)]